MFGIGLPEMILIMALALIVVGPDKLPDLARSLAKGFMELKKTAEGLKKTIAEEGNPLDEIKPDLEEAAQNLKNNLLETPPYHQDDMDSEQGVNPPADKAAEAYQELLKTTGKVSEDGKLISDIPQPEESSTEQKPEASDREKSGESSHDQDPNKTSTKNQ